MQAQRLDYHACLTRLLLQPYKTDLTSCARWSRLLWISFFLGFVSRLHVYQALGKSVFVILHPRHKAVQRRSAVTRQQALQPIRWVKYISHVSTDLDLYALSCSDYVKVVHLKNSRLTVEHFYRNLPNFTMKATTHFNISKSVFSVGCGHVPNILLYLII